jgi:hypothetical protein
VTKQVKNAGASVKAQLRQLARRRGDDYQLLLLRYANERLLYRLAVSPHASRFVLKGAALFTLWTGSPDNVPELAMCLRRRAPPRSTVHGEFRAHFASA